MYVRARDGRLLTVVEAREVPAVDLMGGWVCAPEWCAAADVNESCPCTPSESSSEARGKEAEELRAGIERILFSYGDDELRSELTELLDNIDARDRSERAQLRAMLEEVLRSAAPNRVEHPTMHLAWGRARELLNKIR